MLLSFLHSHPLKNPRCIHAGPFLKLRVVRGEPFVHRSIYPWAHLVNDCRIGPVPAILKQNEVVDRHKIGKPGIHKNARFAVVPIYKNQIKRSVPLFYKLVAIFLNK